MKFFIFVVLLIASTSLASATDCLPDGWVAVKYGGQEVTGPEGDYTGFDIVTIGETSKAVHCEGSGTLKCCVNQNACYADLNNELIGHAITKINVNSILSGNHNINIIIDGFPRYGYVTWNTNSTTGESVITTTIN